MKNWYWLVLGVLLLTGCAPEYETRYELTPPASTGGLSCLNQCEGKSRMCNLQCTRQYDQCSVRAEQQARLELPERLREYDTKLADWKREMDRYETDQRFYEMELHQRQLQRELLHLTCNRDGQKAESCFHQHSKYDSLPSMNPPTSPGASPAQPTLSGETARIRDLTCSKECKCDDQYRQCYSSCGGAVKPYQFCVKNCS